MVRLIAGVYEDFECAVIDGSETSDWFKIKSGVKQGCVMSGFLFLLALDWNMKRTTADKRRGIRWNFTTVLEDFEFADDIALLSSRLNDLHEKTGRLTEEAARVGLKLNARKCKTLRTEYASNRERIAVNGEEVEDVGEFPYLGATVEKEGGGSRDIKSRLQKARGAFQRLGKVWVARGIGRGTKIRLFKTLVRPVLLYGCKTWKITKADERRLNSFQCQCLRRILRIRWQQRISNNRVVEMAEINNISCEIRRRRWSWLGHILRREDENDCFTALGWTPEGRRARGRPKTTWRRTVEKERDKAGWKSWNAAKAVARETESIGQRAWRPYAPTGAKRNDDDDDVRIDIWLETSSSIFDLFPVTVLNLCYCKSRILDSKQHTQSSCMSRQCGTLNNFDFRMNFSFQNLSLKVSHF